MTAKALYVDGRKLCKCCDTYYPANDKFFYLKRDGVTLQPKCMGCCFLRKGKKSK